MPATAALQLYDIATHGVADEHIKSPGERGAFGGAVNFVTGAAAIAYMKTFEMMLETQGELIVQSYKSMFDYFVNDQGAPDTLLIASIAISTCTLAFGLVGAYLNLEVDRDYYDVVPHT